MFWCRTNITRQQEIISDFAVAKVTLNYVNIKRVWILSHSVYQSMIIISLRHDRLSERSVTAPSVSVVLIVRVYGITQLILGTTGHHLLPLITCE